MLVTARIRSLQEGNVFSRMCLSVGKGERSPCNRTCSMKPPSLPPPSVQIFSLGSLSPVPRPGGPTQTCSLEDPLSGPAAKRAIGLRLKGLLVKYNFRGYRVKADTRQIPTDSVIQILVLQLLGGFHEHVVVIVVHHVVFIVYNYVIQTERHFIIPTSTRARIIRKPNTKNM